MFVNDYVLFSSLYTSYQLEKFSFVELIVIAHEIDIIHWERILECKENVFSSESDDIVWSLKTRELFRQLC